MFDLDKEVHRWCRKMCPNVINRRSQAAELEDHFHSAVSALLADNVSPEEAFRSAKAQLGEWDSLRAEYRKNKSWFSIAVYSARRKISVGPLRHVAKSMTLKCTLLLVAAVLVGSGMLLLDTDIAERTRTLITALLNLPFSMNNS